jgi:hypothetical protein
MTEGEAKKKSFVGSYSRHFWLCCQLNQGSRVLGYSELDRHQAFTHRFQYLNPLGTLNVLAALNERGGFVFYLELN